MGGGKSRWPRLVLAATLVACSAPGVAAGADTDAPHAAAAGITTPTPVPPNGLGSPVPDDTEFLTELNDRYGRDCRFSGAGPFEFSIDVTRYVGDPGPDGFLPADTVARLRAAGILRARLRVAAFDVDSDDPTVLPPDQVEIDRVTLNGDEVGFFTGGANDGWRVLTVDLPIEHIKFPPRAPPGQRPVPASNEFVIDVDVGNAAAGKQLWCTALAWASIELRAMAPVVLVHGNNSDGAFFERQGMAPALAQRGVVIDDSISFMPNAAPVFDNAAALANRLPEIVRSFGTDAVHLIVHSKGGLDVRQYLVSYQPSADDEFQVRSVTTLSSPHDGSLLADLQVLREQYARYADVEFDGFPLFTLQASKLAGTDGGTVDLTTRAAAAFTNAQVPLLASRQLDRKKRCIYNTFAADADRDGDGALQRPEYDALLLESAGLRFLVLITPAVLAARLIGIPYHILQTTAALAVNWQVVDSDGTPLFWPRVTISPVLAPKPRGNDLLVTIDSGLGHGGFDRLVPPNGTAGIFQGAGLQPAKNHASIADGEVGATVFEVLRRIEREHGDLQDGLQ